MYRTMTYTALALVLATAFVTGARAQGRGGFAVDDNALVEATLDRGLNTKTLRVGQRVTATVTSPREFRGATLLGTVKDAERSGRVNDDAEITLEFDRIELRDGGSYQFAGTIERVQTPDDEHKIEIGDEGEIKRAHSQTDRSVERGGIGAVAGAIIGGIAGGGSGAAAGAAIGGGAGVGSVAVQGPQDLELPSGTRVVIRASAPHRYDRRD